MAKHILHIITGLQRGGAETVLVTLVTELAQAAYGYRQTVIYFNDGALRQQLENLGVSCHRATYWSTGSLIRTLKPDGIHSSLWSASIIARVWGAWFAIPVYCALHTVAQHSGTVRNSIDRFFPFTATRYIAVSSLVKDSYTRFLPAKRITVIENGVPPARKRTHRPSGRYYTFGTVGRFVPVKNHHILLEAFARVHRDFNETALILVGYGPLERELRDLAKRLAIEHAVTFVIGQPAHEYYHQLDCFVQPSEYEGLSVALLEAMHASLPVIVTGHAQQHAVVHHHKTGIVINPGCADTLYQALVYVLLNKEVTLSYAYAGTHHVHDHFSAHAMAKKYHQVFSA